MEEIRHIPRRHTPESTIPGDGGFQWQLGGERTHLRSGRGGAGLVVDDGEAPIPENIDAVRLAGKAEGAGGQRQFQRSSGLGGDAPDIGAAAALELHHPAGHPLKPCPPHRMLGGEDGEAREGLAAQRQKLLQRILRQVFRIARREAAERVMQRRAALRAAGRGIQRFQRLKAQDVAGEDGIGIAQQRLDLGHG